jgi:predicted MPP superfamily phosphohydrolase
MPGILGIIIFLSVVEAILLGLHLFIYKSTVLLLHVTSHPWLIVLRVIMILGAVSFPVLSVVVFKSSNKLVRLAYYFSAAWLDFFYFLLISSVVSILAYTLLPIGFERAHILIVVLDSAAIIIGIYSLINTKIIRTTRLTIALPYLPEFWKNKNFVFISDMHLGPINGVAFTKHLVKKVMSLNPAAVIIGGDIFDGPTLNAYSALEPIKKAQPSLGKYFVTGNHEEYGNVQGFLKAIRDCGITVLENQTVDLAGINFVGVDYKATDNSEKFLNVLKEIVLPRNKPNILIKHVPDNLKLAEAHGFDASFSGHTHNGQLYPLGYLARWIYGYNYGLKFIDKMQVFVSSGVGTWGPPGRFGTKAEIVLISFEENVK